MSEEYVWQLSKLLPGNLESRITQLESRIRAIEDMITVITEHQHKVGTSAMLTSRPMK